jgi:glycosyltransferase involved in cell wall biosynthesis
MGGAAIMDGDLAIPPRFIGKNKRVLIVNSVIARNDAISAFVRDMYLMLADVHGLRIDVIACKNDFIDVPAAIIANSADLLMHKAFIEADLIIWHFGVFYDLFNALLIGNGHARQIVCFHNVTPKEFLPRDSWATIDRSLRQCHHLSRADEVWPVSGANGAYAERLGVAKERIHVIPLVVDGCPTSSLGAKDVAPGRILYVGRFVTSKGVMDLLEAAVAIRRSGTDYRLTLVGNIEFSSAEYIDQVRHEIESNGLHDQVEWLGTVDDATLCRMYQTHHVLAIPSYHEGFCKPIIEGLRCGCIPVAYAAHSLPETANGLGRMVPTGDVAAFAGALNETLTSLRPAIEEPHVAHLILDRGPTSATAFKALAQKYTDRFSRDRVRLAMVTRLAHLLAESANTQAVMHQAFGQDGDPIFDLPAGGRRAI